MPREEPEWQNESSRKFTLRWRFAPDTRIEYQEKQSAWITSKGRRTDQEHSLNLIYDVREISDDGIAKIIVIGKDLKTKGPGFESLRFLISAKKRMGSFSISPSGQMSDVKGFIDIRSLPTFPDHPVGIGSKWTAHLELAFAPTIPEAIATGICYYHLIGLADVHGHQWVKIHFEAEVAQPEMVLAINKVIGIKPPEMPVESERGIIVGEVIPGRPAKDAGILPGDNMVGFGDMAINSWTDLEYAVSWSECNQPTPLVIYRNKEKIEFWVEPIATLSSVMRSNGHIQGTLIFDITKGRLIMMNIRSFAIKSLVFVGDQTTEIEAHVESQIRLADELN
ncbi:MAG: PDZ domain-containing protein [bacterium]